MSWDDAIPAATASMIVDREQLAGGAHVCP
jgi:hypothetical protein